MNHQKTIVVALGGNAITRVGEEGNIAQQFENTRQSLKGVVEIIKLGHRVILTHGNGPQVGNELIRSEEASRLVPRLPLGILVADTEGGMGYMIEQCLQNVMQEQNVHKETCCVITQVVVDKDDPAIKNPSKFVGPFYDEKGAMEMKEQRGWKIKEDFGRGWRRVVPSPIPKKIVAQNTIKLLVDNGVIVIAAGGGGVPVYDDDNGWREGLDAVIDKDLASAVLGNDVGAQVLMILTSVEKVAINFGKANQCFLSKMTVAEAKQYLEAGQFPAGSMGPKIQAALKFLEGGGERVVITSIEKSVDAVFEKAGTVITN